MEAEISENYISKSYIIRINANKISIHVKKHRNIQQIYSNYTILCPNP
jgi:hypothetical protein